MIAFLNRQKTATIVKQTQTFVHQTTAFNYEIHLSERRTTSLRIKAGKVVVSAPLGTEPESLQRWVSSKSRWVIHQLQKQRIRTAEIPTRTYTTGETLPFMDELLTLEVTAEGRAQVYQDDHKLIVTPSNRGQRPRNERVREQVKAWYKEQALSILHGKTVLLAERLGRAVNEVQMRQTKSKWGHCTARGEIQYNWLILLAPEAVVDYLVTHECSHLIHLNHSAAFWQLVQQHCPDAQTQRQWLRANGHTLVL